MAKEPRFYLPFPIVDSHFHGLHMASRGLDVPTLLAEGRTRGIRGGIEVAVDEHDFQKRVDFVIPHQGMRLSAGIHPSSCTEGNLTERMEKVSRQCAHPLVAAVGETGLDFFREYAPRDVQEKAFEIHLELAADTDLPVIIHNRDADSRVLDIIRNSRCRRGVFHCFSSDVETAHGALDLGFHVSFAGNITYKNVETLHKAAQHVPGDRILVETDSPYLSPQALRSHTNHPGHIGYTVEKLAEIRSEDARVLAKRIVRNAVLLFGLSIDGPTEAHQ